MDWAWVNMLDFVFPLRETLVIQVQQSICRQLFIFFYYYHIIIGISMGLCIFCSLLLLAFLNRSCVNLSWEITRSIEERQATTEENRREVFFFFFLWVTGENSCLSFQGPPLTFSRCLEEKKKTEKSEAANGLSQILLWQGIVLVDDLSQTVFFMRTLHRGRVKTLDVWYNSYKPICF